jgi:diguanylate cyclase (GGDEF)-like protein
VVTVISRFRVRNGLEGEVRNAFLNRPRLVEQAAGFCGLDVLTDAADPAIFLLLTRWTDEESFRSWHRSDAHHQSHTMIPSGLKLDPSFTSLTIGSTIEDTHLVDVLNQSLEGHAGAVSRWLTNSDAVFALLLTPAGDICYRNRASARVFPVGLAEDHGSTIWDYLVCSDVPRLRERLLDTEDQGGAAFLLNLSSKDQNPITLEAVFIRCNRLILLLGTEERRHDACFQDEILRHSNDLSMLMRETARNNRKLQQANETIERLARTDALTGLANRRTLLEVLPQEVARADRLSTSLSVMIGDLDHFKSINDQFGHLAGDHVLASAAAVIASQSRSYDLAVRYGGEEFLLLLPGTAKEEAFAIAERIRNGIAAVKVPGCERQVTISLGVATWTAGESPDQFIGQADAALYRAKNAGRNRVEPNT